MILQFQGNVGIIPISSGINTDKVNSSSRKIAKNRAQDKSSMGNIRRSYFVAYILYTDSRVDTYDLGLNCCNVVVTFACVRK
jgi:hypothetical protein